MHAFASKIDERVSALKSEIFGENWAFRVRFGPKIWGIKSKISKIYSPHDTT